MDWKIILGEAIAPLWQAGWVVVAYKASEDLAFRTGHRNRWATGIAIVGACVFLAALIEWENPTITGYDEAGDPVIHTRTLSEQFGAMLSFWLAIVPVTIWGAFAGWKRDRDAEAEAPPS